MRICNMRGEDIIDSINTIIKEHNGKGFLVLQKQIIPHKSIKAYKIYKYIVWLVQDEHNTSILEVQNSCRVVNDIEHKHSLSIMDKELLLQLIKLISDNIKYKTLLDGSIKEYTNK